MNERGFTLAELLIACAVLGIIMAGVLGIQRQGLGAYQVGVARVEVQQNARAALETMINEIRTAKAVTLVGAGCDTGPVPTGGGATTISITDQNDAAVQYQLVGTTLQRNADPLVGGVQALQIWCFGAAPANTLTMAPALVRSVRVRVRTQTETPVAPNSARDQHALMDTRVQLRNWLPGL